MTLLDSLKRACTELNLRLIYPYELRLNDEVCTFVACLPELGYPKGMLVTTDSGLAMRLSCDLVSAGYGYSTLSEGCEGFDIEVYKEVFSDWGWNGADEQQPTWMT